jgi:ribosome-associated heat shock protein Hsp15
MQLNILDSTRIDKFLWAARFFKTRSLAAEEIGKGRIKINDQVVKASREVKAGDHIDILRQGLVTRIEVLLVSDQRGPAPLAQSLYRETPESIAAREQASDMRRLHREPALAINQGRPTKRDRRDLQRAQDGQSGARWNDRWTAEI